MLFGMLGGMGVLVVAGALAVALAPFEASVGSFRLGLLHEQARTIAATKPRLELRATVPGATEEQVHSVILFIGDGMGIGQVSTAASALGGGLAFARAPVIGLLRTATADAFVTDSAAAATAYATGFRTHLRMLSVLPDGRRPKTLFAAAEQQGLATGVITTSGLLDATAAAFTAHAESRDDLEAVARGMVESGSEVMLGGDWGLSERAAREAEAARVMKILEGAKDRGYALVTSGPELASAPPGPVLGLFPERPGHPGGHGPQLAETTRWALGRLAADAEGFILMVESEETDEAGHNHDLGRLVDGVRELDAAVEVGLEFAAQRPGTLVLVTADHDTGGVGVVGGGPSSGELDVAWATTGHTGQWVPVFAFGAGAGRFAGVHDNSALSRILGKLLDLRGFPDEG